VEDRSAVDTGSGGAPGSEQAGQAAGSEGAHAEAPVLVLRHAVKSFGAVQALVDGSIELYPGEAHALVGENGAGKSTLVKILAGVYQPDAGVLLADGHEITLHNPAAARAAGIAVIYQEPALFPDLSVAENMFIGRQPLASGRRIDRRAMRTETAAIFARLGVQLDPARIARGLSIADQQVVEIGKAISLEARVIVMDEPTAALSAAEVDRLFDVVRTLRAAGTAVLFISHRLEEVFALCQRVTVMRLLTATRGSRIQAARDPRMKEDAWSGSASSDGSSRSGWRNTGPGASRSGRTCWPRCGRPDGGTTACS
jgi:rhamnose transport system ATP-binding protein